jgi:hypothetical protein
MYGRVARLVMPSRHVHVCDKLLCGNDTRRQCVCAVVLRGYAVCTHIALACVTSRRHQLSTAGRGQSAPSYYIAIEFNVLATERRSHPMYVDDSMRDGL